VPGHTIVENSPKSTSWALNLRYTACDVRKILNVMWKRDAYIPGVIGKSVMVVCWLCCGREMEFWLLRCWREIEVFWVLIRDVDGILPDVMWEKNE
jgi:hypothetical protein